MSAVLLSHQGCRPKFPTVAACSNSAFVKYASSQVLQYWVLPCLAFIGDADRRKEEKKEWMFRCVILLLNESSRQKFTNRWSSVFKEHRFTGWAGKLGRVGSLGLRLHSCRTRSVWCFCAWKITHWVPLLYPLLLPLPHLPLSVGNGSVADTYYIKHVRWGDVHPQQMHAESLVRYTYFSCPVEHRWFQGTVF